MLLISLNVKNNAERIVLSQICAYISLMYTILRKSYFMSYFVSYFGRISETLF